MAYPVRIYSVVFPIPCPTVGDVRWYFVVNRYLQQKRSVQYEDSRQWIIFLVLMMLPQWEVSVLRSLWMENSSIVPMNFRFRQ